VLGNNPNFENHEIITHLDSLKSIAHCAFVRMRKQNKWRPATEQLTFNDAWFMELSSSGILRDHEA